MAGFSKLYVIGGLGGYGSADGVNPIQLQIWVGDSDRQWLEPHYIDQTIERLGALQSLIPEAPNDPNSLIDACIAYFPSHFAKCPSMAEVREQLEGIRYLDFHLGRERIPSAWTKLRKEAQQYFNRLNIFEAVLKPVLMSTEDQAR